LDEATSGSRDADAGHRDLELEFRGSARDYFRVWIVNVALTLLTLGVFSAWAKVRKKRYFYAHTLLDGTPFQYLARPVPILKGRIVAAALFAGYYLASEFYLDALPVVLVLAGVLAPWIIVRSAAFNARYSAWRNMTFCFEGRYPGAFKSFYAWGVVPATALSVYFARLDEDDLWVILGLWSLVGLVFAWWYRGMKRFAVEHTAYGGKRGRFGARGSAFFKIYFVGGLFVAAAIFATAFVLKGVTLLLGVPPAELLPVGLWVAGVFLYFGWVVGYAYVEAHRTNLVWRATELGPIRFQAWLTARELLKLYLTNAVVMIASLGLLTPWAVVRTMRYRASRIRPVLAGDWTELEGAPVAPVAAAGSEMGELFELDFSL
jgi:uncharacterized membrane protein YjgN (DUF898 family)